MRMILCKCPCCDILISEFDKRGRKRRFAKGHGNKGRVFSEEARKNMSKPKSEKHRKNIGIGNKGKIRSEGFKQNVSEKHKGKVLSPETRQLISKSKQGQIPWNKGKKLIGKPLSDEHKQKIKESWIKRKQDPNYDPKMYGSPGKKHPAWKGGIAYELYCIEWDIWLKEEIKERDGFECQNPNCTNEITETNQLCVHHINYQKKDCSANNLITICRSCNAKANFNKDYWKELYSNILGI